MKCGTDAFPNTKLLMKGVLTHLCRMHSPIFLSLSTGSIPRLSQGVQILELEENLLALLLTNLGAP